MKKILWLALIVIFLVSVYQALVVYLGTPEHYQLPGLAYADQQGAHDWLAAWQAAPYGRGTLLDVARSNLHLDFGFIFVYTMLILLLSYLQMQRERSPRLNAYLRLNIFLALILTVSDILENILLLYDIRHINDHGLYLSPWFFSTLKWLLTAWVVGVYLISRSRETLVKG
ncbi:hypothetical protein [Mucilaginibacter sp.]|uniref:hypothetical protein n=1 Tax=Mucilaginibacter sp. TaxID=1882438 RepID=UPI00261831BA|nr:hypothetical protein [Mucilaginibacter sp.]MDB4922906.1 hypothetical protein [Mucilaginibacter sp.]